MNKNVLWSVGAMLMISGVVGVWTMVISGKQASIGELFFMMLAIVGACFVLAAANWKDREP